MPRTPFDSPEPVRGFDADPFLGGCIGCDGTLVNGSGFGGHVTGLALEGVV